MTQEQKDKLFKYLCMALPYDVFMTNKEYPETHYPLTTKEVHDLMYEEDFNDIPYLRPMSSMTEEEKIKLSLAPIYASTYYNDVAKIDWLLEHHFDFMGLIDEGLAIDCSNLDIYKD